MFTPESVSLPPPHLLRLPDTIAPEMTASASFVMALWLASDSELPAMVWPAPWMSSAPAVIGWTSVTVPVLFDGKMAVSVAPRLLSQAVEPLFQLRSMLFHWPVPAPLFHTM